MIKVGFDVKFGHNEIELPVNGGKLYADNAPKGLSELNDNTFTIINQIPQSSTINTKVKWIKHRLNHCSKKDGIYDKSTGQMFVKANNWTCYLHAWQKYKEPDFIDGYYSLADDEMQESFTANVGDLIVFADIVDDVPTTLQEFNSLVAKYRDMGGTITSVQAYISYKPNGAPWKTNHIECIKN